MQSNQDELFPSFVEEEHYNPKTAEIIEKEICIKTFENLLSENEQNIKTLTDLIDDKDKLLSDLNNKMIIKTKVLMKPFRKSKMIILV